MKKVRVTTILAMVFLSLTAMASNNSEKDNSLKGTSKNPTLVANLFFLPTTSLPKYSFSQAKFRFQRLVSEKNNCLIIPNRVIRDALNTKTNQREIRTSNNMGESQQSKVDISVILKNYMSLKDALVADDNEAAQNAGKLLMKAFKKFDISGYSAKNQKELKDIIGDATENAEHISGSPIAHQREHFKQLSIDVNDMVAITGTKVTLYQQFCPMYDSGSAWLSKSKDIKNPYYGSKMSTCGKVQKVIN